MPRIVVIGSTGQLAADLMRVFGADAVGLTHQDLDVTDAAATMQKLQQLGPAWVVNTASYNRVDACEADAGVAFAVNAQGAYHVARASAAVGAGVVYFSTDYVFGGDERSPAQPYVESDRPAPLNVYGASKVAGEHLVRLANPRHLVIRTASLYGGTTSRKGWTFPELMLQKARSDGKLQVVCDQIMSPTYTADLAVTVKGLMDANALGLFHAANSGECSWFEFTRQLLELAGVKAELIAITTAESGRMACRPAYSALASSRQKRPLRPWHEALRDYLVAKPKI